MSLIPRELNRADSNARDQNEGDFHHPQRNPLFDAALLNHSLRNYSILIYLKIDRICRRGARLFTRDPETVKQFGKASGAIRHENRYDLIKIPLGANIVANGRRHVVDRGQTCGLLQLRGP